MERAPQFWIKMRREQNLEKPDQTFRRAKIQK